MQKYNVKIKTEIATSAFGLLAMTFFMDSMPARE